MLARDGDASLVGTDIEALFEESPGGTLGPADDSEVTGLLAAGSSVSVSQLMIHDMYSVSILNVIPSIKKITCGRIFRSLTVSRPNCSQG